MAHIFELSYGATDNNYENAFIYASNFDDAITKAKEFVKKAFYDEHTNIAWVYVLGISDAVLGFSLFFKVNHQITFNEQE